jgi:hypothetical protein
VKLWTVLDLTRIPYIFHDGLTNPYYEEIIFHKDPDILAEQVLDRRMEEGEDYLPAFIQVDFPDDELDDWFTACLESSFLELDEGRDRLQEEWDYGNLTTEQANKWSGDLDALDEALEKDDVWALFELSGFACLRMVVPPEMLTLLDPATMLEAVLTGDQTAILEAAQMAEAKDFQTLGSGFWVWMIMFMAGLFGPNWAEETAQAEEKARERRARRRRRKPAKKKKPSRKGKKKKARATS